MLYSIPFGIRISKEGLVNIVDGNLYEHERDTLKRNISTT
jgi:hypothetical protein